MYIVLVEIFLVSALLLIGYRLLLERRTDFRWCRAYLLALPMLSVVIPLLEIPLWPAKSVALPTITAGEIAAEVVTAEVTPVITLQSVFVIFYSLGVVLLLGLMLYQWWRIIRLRRNARVESVQGVSIVRTRTAVASFSFFNSIYISAETSAEDLTVILKHECSHIRHGHSYERLAMELQKALLWWNPFVWYAARLLTEVEEFEADRDVLSEGEDRTIYIQTIFKQMFGYSPEIANSLRDSLTKKRLIMMTTNFRSRYARLRQAAILPMILALVVVFGSTARAAQEPEVKKTLMFVSNVDEGKQPICLVDGKVVENINELDADMIASMSVLKGGEQLQEAVKNTSISVEEATQRGVIVIEMVKPENYVKQGEEALYRGVVLDYEGEPIVGAIIKIGQRGVVTDMDGRFELRATRGEVGEVMYVGYESGQLHFANNAELTVRLAKEGEKQERTITIYSDKLSNGEMTTVNIDNGGSVQQGRATVYSLMDGNAQLNFGKVYTFEAGEPTEKMPSFQGGDLEDFRRWVMTKVRFPQQMLDKGVYGRVLAIFVIDTDGSVSNVDILQTPDKAYSDEVIRVLMSSPKWEAGVAADGKPVAVQLTLPIDFALHDGEKLNASEDKAPAKSATTAEEIVVAGYGTKK